MDIKHIRFITNMGNISAFSYEPKKSLKFVKLQKQIEAGLQKEWGTRGVSDMKFYIIEEVKKYINMHPMDSNIDDEFIKATYEYITENYKKLCMEIKIEPRKFIILQKEVNDCLLKTLNQQRIDEATLYITEYLMMFLHYFSADYISSDNKGKTNDEFIKLLCEHVIANNKKHNDTDNKIQQLNTKYDGENMKKSDFNTNDANDANDVDGVYDADDIDDTDDMLLPLKSSEDIEATKDRDVRNVSVSLDTNESNMNDIFCEEIAKALRFIMLQKKINTYLLIHISQYDLDMQTSNIDKILTNFINKTASFSYLFEKYSNEALFVALCEVILSTITEMLKCEYGKSYSSNNIDHQLKKSIKNYPSLFIGI